MSSEQETAKSYSREFVEAVRENRTVWGLWSEAAGWAATESDSNIDTEVILFWSESEAAEKHQQDEWQDHALISIPLDEFLESTLPEMTEEGVLIGPDWDEDFVGEELTPSDVSTRLLALVDEDGEEEDEEEELED